MTLTRVLHSVHEVWQMNVLIFGNPTWKSQSGVPTSPGNPSWESQHLLGIPVGSPNITWESHLGVPTSLGNPTYPFLKLVPGVPDMWDSQHFLGIPLGSPNFIWDSQVGFPVGTPLGAGTTLGIFEC